MKRNYLDDNESTVHNNHNNRLRKSQQRKNFYLMRNIIKKVKTHGFKFFTRCLLALTSVRNYHRKNSKTIYKLFKSDICKSRNRCILDFTMKQLLLTFSTVDMEYLNSSLRKDKLTFNFLMNLTWGEFLRLIRNQNQEIRGLMGERQRSIKITPSDVKKYYEYIYQGIDYKTRTTTDDSYIKLYSNLESQNVKFEQQDLVDDFINSYEGIL
jgi:hypothetical protein